MVPAAPARLSPALPVGEQLEHNLYAGLRARRRPARTRIECARQYGAIYTRFRDALRDGRGRPPVIAD